MKPEDLSPSQVLQLAALGLILLSLLAASVTSWGVLLFRISKGLGFQASTKPTASVGFIDCLIGFLAVVFCLAMAVSTWRVFVNPPQIGVIASDTQPDIQSDQKEIDSKDEKKSTITKEEVLGSGWVSVFQLMAAFITMIIVAGRIGWDWRALGLSTSGIFRDIGIGIWVLLLMLPPIFMINIATSLVSGIEYSHPIIDAIKNYPWLVG
ncbi:MAG: hypothetical protein MUC83_15630, partial [Pirellula sp.]|nr:hypothetical protein [Pirellula sp.]